jgi:type II pantothenate kinase
MGFIVGIDIGGSTTKIVGFQNETMLPPLLVRATDALTSVFGAFGKLLNENNLSLSDIDSVMVTGVGGHFLRGTLYDLPTVHVNEFHAIGLGGLTLTGLPEAVIVSMGTGTAMVHANSSDIRYIGGTGVGGGTLLGLGNALLHVRGFDAIMEMARDGDKRKTDLSIGDITGGALQQLPPETTAANFGKMDDLATKNDWAAGIVNMVFEAIGMTAIFAARSVKSNDIVLTGNLTTSPLTTEIINGLTAIFPERFYLPENAEFATAIGAAKTKC